MSMFLFKVIFNKHDAIHKINHIMIINTKSYLNIYMIFNHITSYNMFAYYTHYNMTCDILIHNIYIYIVYQNMVDEEDSHGDY